MGFREKKRVGKKQLYTGGPFLELPGETPSVSLWQEREGGHTGVPKGGSLLILWRGVGEAMAKSCGGSERSFGKKCPWEGPKERVLASISSQGVRESEKTTSPWVESTQWKRGKTEGGEASGDGGKGNGRPAIIISD